MRSESEIEAELYQLDPEDVLNGRTAYPGMTYEQGVENALQWALGHWDDKPVSEE